MNNELHAIAHPHRLSILRAVTRHEQTVGELARQLKLRQPATSQHLSILKNADLVTVRPVGNKRYYIANPDALGKLRTFLDGFWQDSLTTLKRVAENTTHE